jgi:pimeloyl-ACP methyl ester carboxylesterase
LSAQPWRKDPHLTAAKRPAVWVRGGRVHRGFKDALEEAWADIFPYMKKLADQGCTIWVAGHSLGAALTTLAADRFQEVGGLYTFGSPQEAIERFKYEAFTKDHSSKAFMCAGHWQIIRFISIVVVSILMNWNRCFSARFNQRTMLSTKIWSKRGRMHVYLCYRRRSVVFPGYLN